jgi:hypothetical protein
MFAHTALARSSKNNRNEEGSVCWHVLTPELKITEDQSETWAPC